MNKKFIAAAIAAACIAAPAAYAESTMYGKLHTSIDGNDISSGGATVKDNFEVNSRSSRLGFKGTEDLGGGLKAIFQIEFGIETDDNDPRNNMVGRNTFIGLAGDWGTFLVGRHDTPAKLAFYASGNELLGDSILDLNISSAGLNPIGVFNETRASNAIAYVSPSFSGFTLAAAIVPGEESVNAQGHGSQMDADSIADNISVGLMYQGYGLKVGVGYEELEHQNFHAAADAPGQNQEMWQVGASYTFNNFSIGAQYETDDNYRTVNNAEYEAWGVTAKASFGNNAVSAVYTTSEAQNGAGATVSDTDGWGLAAEHNFSKRTKAYVAYASAEDDGSAAAGDEGEDDRFSLGMIHSF